jgi:hypothetical protein
MFFLQKKQMHRILSLCSVIFVPLEMQKYVERIQYDEPTLTSEKLQTMLSNRDAGFSLSYTCSYVPFDWGSITAHV